MHCSYVLGIDIDEDALDICYNNLTDFEISTVDMLRMDALALPPSLCKCFDTVVMNPPFGTKHNKGNTTTAALVTVNFSFVHTIISVLLSKF